MPGRGGSGTRGGHPPCRQPLAPGTPARAGRTRRDRSRSPAQAAAIIDRHQWLAAVTAFANPVLALGPMAVGAVQLRMLSEMAAVYDVQLSSEFVEKVGQQMAQTLLKLGVAEAAASVLAGLIKFNPLGFAAGGIVQAVTMAYLTRLTGSSFVEYLEHGQSWGEAGMQAVSVPPARGNPPLGMAFAVRQDGDPPPVPSIRNVRFIMPALAGRKQSPWHDSISPSNMASRRRSRKRNFRAAIHEAQSRFR